jgi:hypothetical protein
MKRLLATIIFGSTLLLISAARTNADPESCRDAADKYQSAKSDISSALRSYSSCISSSDGHDDCSSEFSTLRSDQSDFDSAVSEYESECS